MNNSLTQDAKQDAEQQQQEQDYWVYLADECKQALTAIGKEKLWHFWADFSLDVYGSDHHGDQELKSQMEEFWKEKLCEAVAAEEEAKPNKELKEKIAELRTRVQKLASQAGCSSSEYFEQMLAGLEYQASEECYWNKLINKLLASVSAQEQGV